MRVAVVGSRGFNDYLLLKETLLNHFITRIVSGGAKGADKLAEKFAEEHGIPLDIHKPDWKRYGKAAGPKRNVTIVEESDKVIAFWDGESRGTKSSINLAESMGKEVVIVKFRKAS